VKALLASALTALVLVTAAWASNVTPAQLSALSKRVTKLENQNATLAARITPLEATAHFVTTCLHSFQAVSQFGDPASGNGYTFANSDGSTQLASALDVPDLAVGETPAYWFVEAPSTCVSAK
jgi:hypothetical protein